eukprot:TRINITY_DN124937_c0_g1_i1.p1 TRINITY_DN124937_c0_g1~~TRINITY_DN124937_c0_g1_i1.p1  ORF type:complete len:702 (-),score=139.16 TRINITY_DN124937_c0_g1_i1:71-2176(-)
MFCVRSFTLSPGSRDLGVALSALPPGPIFVKTVHPESFAYNRGIHAGDELLSVAGRSVADLTAKQFKEQLARRPVTLLIQASPGIRALHVVVDTTHLGFELSAWPPDAVKISKVAARSWADFSGLQPGDEIVAVEGVQVADMQTGKEDIMFKLKARPLKLLVRFSPGKSPVQAPAQSGGYYGRLQAGTALQQQLHQQQQQQSAPASPGIDLALLGNVRDWEASPGERSELSVGLMTSNFRELEELTRRSTHERSITVRPGSRELGLGLSNLPPGPVFVKSVVEDSFASSQGLERGDEIQALDGLPVFRMTGQQVRDMLHRRPLRIKLLCDAGYRTLTMPTDVQGLLGLAFVGTPPTEVTIRTVSSGSWADDSGLEAGDELVAVNGEHIAEMAGNADLQRQLKVRPLKMRFLFRGMRQGAPYALPLPELPSTAVKLEAPPLPPLPPPPVPPPTASALAQPGSSSPRHLAHAALINALTAHDAEKLQEAIAMARVLKMDGPGLSACERALEALGGLHAVGSAERRRKAAFRLQTLLATGKASAAALRSAVDEAVDSGVEDMEVIEAAEQALVELRKNRGFIMDTLVDKLERVVIAAEHNVTTGCPQAELEILSSTLEKAEMVATPADEHLVLTAKALLEFHTGRTAALTVLHDKVHRRAHEMEKAVDHFQRDMLGDLTVDTTGPRARPVADQELQAPLGLRPS